MYEYMVAIYRRASKEKKIILLSIFSDRFYYFWTISLFNYSWELKQLIFMTLGYQFCPWGRLLFSLAGERWIVQVHVADLNYLY